MGIKNAHANVVSHRGDAVVHPRMVDVGGGREQAPAPNSDRLSSLDNLFLLSENCCTHMHVAVTAIFEAGPLRSHKGGVDGEQIRDYIRSRLHLIPRYRQRLAHFPLAGRPRWVDDESFDIDYHVRHTSLPRPGNEQQLQWLVGSIKSQQLDRSKPLWETWIVEGLEGGRFALVTKAHHCMVDGMSGAALLEVLLQPEPQAVVEPALPFNPRPVPRALAILKEEMAWRVRAPLALASRLVREPSDVLRKVGEGLSAVADLLPAGFHRASDTPLNGAVGPHRRFAWLEMTLAAVKAIKNRLGGTLNDVVLATVAGAVRRFLLGRGIDVSTIDFRALVPVSMRTSDERGTLGNRVAAWIVSLPVSEPNARERLADVCETTSRLKQSGQAAGTEILTSVTEWTGSALLSAAIQLAFRTRPFNLVVTNVPGPPFPLYLLGARMLAVYPQVPLFMNQNLGVALFSYAGTLYWGFNADRDRVPDLDGFVAAVQASFAELQRAAGLELNGTRRVAFPRHRNVSVPSPVAEGNGGEGLGRGSTV